jgi:hypothetical protein
MTQLRGMRLFALLMATGVLVTFVHDYAYRRVDTRGVGEYEFSRLISHAGTDMLITTIIVSVVAVLYARSLDR